MSGHTVPNPPDIAACAARRERPVAGRTVLVRRLLMPILAATLFLLPLAAAAQAARPGPPGGPPGPSRPEAGTRILLLYSEPRMTPAIGKVDETIRRTLQARAPAPVFFYTEYLDLNLFDGPEPQREMRELLRRKYASRNISLIVAAGRALRIALHNRAELFSAAPIVFVAADPTGAAELRLGPDVTGTWLRLPWAETLDLARRLQPGLERAVIVGGSSPADRVWLAAARRQLTGYSGPVAISYLTDVSVDVMVQHVHTLPARSVVIMGPVLRDANGRDSTTTEVAREIAAASSVPVFGLTDTLLGTGAVGGRVVDFEAHGRVAAELALRVLAGERPAATDAGTTVPMFDIRQLDRWGIDHRRLPADSVILFREPSLWQQYRWYILGAASLLALQTVLIGGLLLQRAQRRRAQRGLADRLRFETLLSDLSTRLSACPASAVDAEIELGLRRIVDAMGVDRANLWAPRGTDEVARTHSWTREGAAPAPAVIRESDAPQVFASVRRGEIVHYAGGVAGPVDQGALEQLGMRSIAVVPLVVGASPQGALSISVSRAGQEWPTEIIPRLRLLADVFGSALGRQHSERAATESAEQIRHLAGQLMTAQEEEGRRIARELHDDVSQDLAAVSIALSMLERQPETASRAREELGRLRKQVGDISEGVRHLSHDLHPGVLEQAGLVPALRGYCHEVERKQGPKVVFHADDGAGAVPANVALCLYRVTQEALRNVVRHAKAERVYVSLTRGGAGIRLTISDDGSGFTVDEGRGRGGLGLISIEERARLVGGTLTIHSQPQHGTDLDLVVPLSQDGHGARDHTAG